MHDEHPHPLLAQVPLTISPFLSLPTSVPLPYSYKTLPSTLPASILHPLNQSNQSSSDQNPQQPPAYITSSTGTSSTPDAILTSCLALQQHLQKLEDEARQTLRDWEERRRQEDLAEKRRVAPGWLDSGVHILKPEEGNTSGEVGGGKVVEGGVGIQDLMDDDPQRREIEERKVKEGEDLDRVFGGLAV
ncbi:hypothetical protein CC86DRAFT_369949 [Ophiobolus disseminans]|uniref:Uncharacterized protein n=1 Tax=Ophiobolus disseminans TaxID=1469910 RepID=A0A6A7A0D2_9PLEO|nr:hypothetical protein CC86DRAFT_369949 [Ophiobolus disseminans]